MRNPVQTRSSLPGGSRLALAVAAGGAIVILLVLADTAHADGARGPVGAVRGTAAEAPAEGVGVVGAAAAVPQGVTFIATESEQAQPAPGPEPPSSTSRDRRLTTPLLERVAGALTGGSSPAAGAPPGPVASPPAAAVQTAVETIINTASSTVEHGAAGPGSLPVPPLPRVPLVPKLEVPKAPAPTRPAPPVPVVQQPAQVSVPPRASAPAEGTASAAPDGTAVPATGRRREWASRYGGGVRRPPTTGMRYPGEAPVAAHAASRYEGEVPVAATPTHEVQHAAPLLITGAPAAGAIATALESLDGLPATGGAGLLAWLLAVGLGGLLIGLLCADALGLGPRHDYLRRRLGRTWRPTWFR